MLQVPGGTPRKKVVPVEHDAVLVERGVGQLPAVERKRLGRRPALRRKTDRTHSRAFRAVHTRRTRPRADRPPPQCRFFGRLARWWKPGSFRESQAGPASTHFFDRRIGPHHSDTNCGTRRRQIADKGKASFLMESTKISGQFVGGPIERPWPRRSRRPPVRPPRFPVADQSSRGISPLETATRTLGVHCSSFVQPQAIGDLVLITVEIIIPGVSC